MGASAVVSAGRGEVDPMASTIEVVRGFLDRDAAGGVQGTAAYFAEDVVFHLAGRGAISGDHRGKEGFFVLLGQMSDIVDSMSIEVHDVLASDGHAVVLDRVTVSRGDRTLTSDRILVLQVGGGRIAEVWVVHVDQQAIDEFLS
jgi:ketosteroid isomerase-like protein